MVEERVDEVFVRSDVDSLIVVGHDGDLSPQLTTDEAEQLVKVLRQAIRRAKEPASVA